MTPITVIETNLSFTKELAMRTATNYLVVHHAASVGDISASEINEDHQALGWAGCGYHYVIRYNGDIERGRPRNTVGAHAYGVNECSIGVVLSGNFMTAEPTDSQIISLVNLLTILCGIYQLDSAAIIMHRDVADLVQDPSDVSDCLGDRLIRYILTWYHKNDATDCPGDRLYDCLKKMLPFANCGFVHHDRA